MKRAWASTRVSHQAETMLVDQLGDGRWRATCSNCGGIANLSDVQGESGTATCFGSEILVARNPNIYSSNRRASISPDCHTDQ